DVRPLADRDDLVGLSCDAALLTDGSTPGVAFLAIAGVVSQSASLLFTGFAGDCLSGSWNGVEPWRARTIRELAQQNQDVLGFLIAPSLVADLLPAELRVSVDDLLHDWEESYEDEGAESKDLVSAQITHRFAERHRRRTATLFHSL